MTTAQGLTPKEERKSKTKNRVSVSKLPLILSMFVIELYPEWWRGWKRQTRHRGSRQLKTINVWVEKLSKLQTRTKRRDDTPKEAKQPQRCQKLKDAAELQPKQSEWSCCWQPKSKNLEERHLESRDRQADPEWRIQREARDEVRRELLQMDRVWPAHCDHRHAWTGSHNRGFRIHLEHSREDCQGAKWGHW